MNWGETNDWFKDQRVYYIMWDHTKTSCNYRVLRRDNGVEIGCANAYSDAQTLAYKHSIRGIQSPYIDYLRATEFDLMKQLASDDVAGTKRRMDVIGMMLDITKDALEREGKV